MRRAAWVVGGVGVYGCIGLALTVMVALACLWRMWASGGMRHRIVVMNGDASEPWTTWELEAAAPCLAWQGSLVRTTLDDRPRWVVRYKAFHAGRMVHRSIYIGADTEAADQIELRRRVRASLSALRSQGIWLRHLGRLRRCVGHARRHTRRLGQH